MNASTMLLVEALTAAGDPDLGPLIERARAEEFHDFVGPHACGITLLVAELNAAGHHALADRAKAGEFDATREESEAWARSEDGRATIRELGEGPARALGFSWPDDEPPSEEQTTAAPASTVRPTPDPKLIELAGRALRIAMRGPTDGGMLDIAQRIVLRIAHEFPSEGVWCTCLMWCDTLQGHVPGLSASDLDGVGLAFIESQTGHRSHADDTVPEHHQWAGRFLLARLRDDPDQAVALFRSTTDPLQLGQRVMALLAMVALNMRQGAVEFGTELELGIGGARA